MTCEAGGHSPLIEAGGADATGFERVPDMAALAHPTVLSAWRRVAFRARMSGPVGSLTDVS
jgi:hypothetical protein